jgi:hypothetical protein
MSLKCVLAWRARNPEKTLIKNAEYNRKYRQTNKNYLFTRNSKWILKIYDCKL